MAKDKDFQANARLIAAAPELLEALKDLADTADYLVRNDYKDTPLDESVKRARAALAKAEPSP